MTQLVVDGTRSSAVGTGGVDIGLMTAGSGPTLLLVHESLGQIERWGPMWASLTARWRVTAMDRRGRGSSGDADSYSIAQEAEDIAAVASTLAEEAGGPVDVFAHSYGATCTLGAAGGSASSFRRMALYEPPGRASMSPEWVDRVTALVAEGNVAKAMVSFLMEVLGLTSQEVDDLRRAPPPYDILAVLSATMPREGKALLGADLSALATTITCPTLLLLGDRGPQWAADNTRMLAGSIAGSEVVLLPAVGHDAIDVAPELLIRELERFFAAG